MEKNIKDLPVFAARAQFYLGYSASPRVQVVHQALRRANPLTLECSLISIDVAWRLNDREAGHAAVEKLSKLLDVPAVDDIFAGSVDSLRPRGKGRKRG
jgi:hypothetical protein